MKFHQISLGMKPKIYWILKFDPRAFVKLWDKYKKYY